MYRLIILIVLIVAKFSIWDHLNQKENGPAQLNVRDVIELAANAAPAGIIGKIEMDVLAGAKIANKIYLNSELDYRDQRSISIVIPGQLALDFAKKYGALPDEYLLFRKIAVTGEAKRVKISFYSKGEKTNKYYYQTHLKITSLEQIEIL